MVLLCRRTISRLIGYAAAAFASSRAWNVGPCLVGPVPDSGPELYVASSRAIGKLAYLDKNVNRLLKPSYCKHVGVVSHVLPSDADYDTANPIAPPCSIGGELDVFCCVAYRLPGKTFDASSAVAQKEFFGFQAFLQTYWDQELTALQSESLSGDSDIDLLKTCARERLQDRWRSLPDDERKPYRREQWAHQFPRPKDRIAKEWRRAVLEGTSWGGRRLIVRFLDTPRDRLAVTVLEVRPACSMSTSGAGYKQKP